MKKYLPIVVTVAVLLLDQASKFLVKLNMILGEEIVLFSWFRIHFIENEGMAFGMSLGPTYGKLLLSLFRMVAIGLLIWYIVKVVRKGKESNLGIAALSLILAGAMGNMLDSAFYGLIFSDSYFQTAQLMPANGGYAPFLFGKVVDMLYFPLFKVGNFTFFDPVFNIADSAITIGFVLFFLSQIKISREVRLSQTETV
ncbi:MAG: lipoprotein signal peptidase [Bacteroidales bacterium]|nr:lipoprotein signal peptidase [Bacteroidales bacterium]